nr:MAG TPA: Putative transcriptional regulator [Caudoviricetes sp.]
METRKAQREAFVLISQNLTEHLYRALDAVKKLQPCTYEEVTQYLKSTTSQSTSRLNDLYHLGLIRVTGMTDDKPRKSIYRVNTPEEAKATQKELLKRYQSERNNLINGLGLVKEHEAITLLTLQKVKYFTEKIKLIKRHKV